MVNCWQNESDLSDDRRVLFYGGEEMLYQGFVTATEEIDAETTTRLVSKIINLFSNEEMSCSAACHILGLAQETISDYSIVQSLERKKS